MEEKGEIFDRGELLLELLRELADILQARDNRLPGINQEHLHLNLVFRGAGHLLLGLVVSGPGPCRQRELLQNESRKRYRKIQFLAKDARNAEILGKNR